MAQARAREISMVNWWERHRMSVSEERDEKSCEKGGEAGWRERRERRARKGGRREGRKGGEGGEGGEARKVGIGGNKRQSQSKLWQAGISAGRERRGSRLYRSSEGGKNKL